MPEKRSMDLSSLRLWIAAAALSSAFGTSAGSAQQYPPSQGYPQPQPLPVQGYPQVQPAQQYPQQAAPPQQQQAYPPAQPQVQQGYPPAQQGYPPAQQGYPPAQQGYQPPQQDYGPYPQQPGYGQPAYGAPYGESVLPYAVDAMRLGARFRLDFGGEAEFDLDGSSPSDDDMLVTLGLEIPFEIPLHKLFTIGPVLRGFLWNNESSDDADIGRWMTLELSVLPKLRYPFLVGQTLMEVHAGVPIGIGLNFGNDDVAENVQMGLMQMGMNVGDIDLNSAIGWHVGFQAGFVVFISPTVGLGLDFGYLYHSYGHEFDLQQGNVDADISWGQFGLSAGLTFAL